MKYSFCCVSNNSDKLNKLRSNLHSIILDSNDFELISIESDSITKGYNELAARAQGEVLVFLHNDLEIISGASSLISMYYTCISWKTGFVGAAGTRHLDTDLMWWKNTSFLSGCVLHSQDNKVWPTSFGPYGNVIVLDGLFLACSREVFKDIGGFDESLSGFDFYDIEITMKAHLAGYTNYTEPIMLIHQGLGDITNRPDWHKNKDLVYNKYVSKLPLFCRAGK